jgi:uncharacterized LabA/DUF88 family protein
MSKKKIAVFVDWENIRKGVFQEVYKTAGKKIDYNHVENALKLILSFIEANDEEIYRIFVYLCEPYGGIINGFDYKTTSVYVLGSKFIEDIQVKDYVAVRKGKLAVRGFDKFNKPIFVQKQVDMLIGLDIAHIAFNNYADRALILSFDTDIIPAMKTARMHGLQVIWGWCSDVLGNPPDALRKHSDFIRDKNFNSIFP